MQLDKIKIEAIFYLLKMYINSNFDDILLLQRYRGVAITSLQPPSPSNNISSGTWWVVHDS